MTRTVLHVACCVAFVVAGPAAGDDKMPIELKIVNKKNSYPWPYEQKPKDFEAKLQEIIKKKAVDQLPKPPAVDLVLQFTNTSKEKAIIHVEGDPNTLTLSVKGPSVVPARPGLAVTTEFRLPKAVELQPGKSHEVSIKSLADGHRRLGRYLYPTAPGEYTISATYELATQDGGKAGSLKSNETKFTIEEPK
jgi:hypothetical protein